MVSAQVGPAWYMAYIANTFDALNPHCWCVFDGRILRVNQKGIRNEVALGPIISDLPGVIGGFGSFHHQTPPLPGDLAGGGLHPSSTNPRACPLYSKSQLQLWCEWPPSSQFQLLHTCQSNGDMVDAMHLTMTDWNRISKEKNREKSKESKTDRNLQTVRQ